MRLLLLAILLVGCKSVAIKNTRECVVAGVFQAGMDCAMTNTGQISQMDVQEMIQWMEPQTEQILEDGTKVKARAGAVCRSDDDFTAQKTSLEQACALLKDRCTADMQAQVYGMNRVSKMGQDALFKKSNAEVYKEIEKEKTGPF